MSEICPKCGLPKELCVCDVLDRETNKKIRIYTEKKKFKKYMTVIEGLTGDELEKTTKELKQTLACGGTDKNGVIELQGAHNKAVIKKILLSMGYPDSSIEVA
ncbi:MAG: stress response translation initiation inhibitor YciH [Candidatus Micrarchaeia archaeon]